MKQLSLDDCPREVQLSIFENLPRLDLVRLSKTSKALHRITESLIYSDVQFEWTREFYPPITELLQLLRTLLERPELCGYVAKLQFDGYGYADDDEYCGSDWTATSTDPPPHIPSLPLPQLTTAIERIGVSESDGKGWLRKVQEGNPEVAMAVLVSLLPGLKHLSISANWANQINYLGTVFRSALCMTHGKQSRRHIPTLGNVKYVSLESMIHDFDHLEEENAVDALALFYLPNVRKMSVSIDNPINFSWPCSSPPDPTLLTSLEISTLREIRLAPVLSATQSLKRLRYNWFFRRDLHPEVSKSTIMLDIMSKAFLEVSSTLEDLHITAKTSEAISLGDIDRPEVYYDGLLNLQGMHRLRTLTVEWSFLVGPTTNVPTGIIGGALPSNLQQLVTKRYIMPEEIHKDEEMVSLIERELESGALMHIKSLQTLCLPPATCRRGMSEACKERLEALGKRFNLALISGTK